MNDINAQQGKVQAFGLVRDERGRPVFDDASNIPEPLWNMLTEAEQEEIINGRHTSP